MPKGSLSLEKLSESRFQGIFFQNISFQRLNCHCCKTPFISILSVFPVAKITPSENQHAYKRNFRWLHGQTGTYIKGNYLVWASKGKYLQCQRKYRISCCYMLVWSHRLGLLPGRYRYPKCYSCSSSGSPSKKEISKHPLQAITILIPNFHSRNIK